MIDNSLLVVSIVVAIVAVIVVVRARLRAVRAEIKMGKTELHLIIDSAKQYRDKMDEKKTF